MVFRSTGNSAPYNGIGVLFPSVRFVFGWPVVYFVYELFPVHVIPGYACALCSEVETAT